MLSGRSHVRKLHEGNKSETSTAAALKWEMHVDERRDNTYFDSLPTSIPSERGGDPKDGRTIHPSIAVNATPPLSYKAAEEDSPFHHLPI